MSNLFRNIPNILTVSRIILAPIFFILFIINYKYIAIICFFIASITDVLDGFLARKLNIVSKFGKLYDPLADKILVFLGFLCIVIEPPFEFIPISDLIYSNPPITMYFSHMFNLQPNTVIYLILATLLFRDFIATTLREVKLRKEKIILKTNFIAKLKTVATIISIHLYLLYQLFGGVDAFIIPKGAIGGPQVVWSILHFFDYFLYLTLLLSLFSLINYINQYRSKDS